jgi:hypothetical protein
LKIKSALNLGAADGPPKASIIVFYRGRFPELAGAHAQDSRDSDAMLEDSRRLTS